MLNEWVTGPNDSNVKLKHSDNNWKYWKGSIGAIVKWYLPYVCDFDPLFASREHWWGRVEWGCQKKSWSSWPSVFAAFMTTSSQWAGLYYSDNQPQPCQLLNTTVSYSYEYYMFNVELQGALLTIISQDLGSRKVSLNRCFHGPWSRAEGTVTHRLPLLHGCDMLLSLTCHSP